MFVLVWPKTIGFPISSLVKIGDRKAVTTISCRFQHPRQTKSQASALWTWSWPCHQCCSALRSLQLLQWFHPAADHASMLQLRNLTVLWNCTMSWVHAVLPKLDLEPMVAVLSKWILANVHSMLCLSLFHPCVLETVQGRVLRVTTLAVP